MMKPQRERILQYYSRKDVQRGLVDFAKDREVAVRYSTKGYGKRPDMLQYENDVFELARQGATSFHMSEEHWSNPLSLKAGMSRKELDELRIGFDCVFDIDTPFFEYAQLTTDLLVEALQFNNITSIGLKYSGNRGFHILIPFSSFPQRVNLVETRLLFPDAPRTISDYLKNLIRDTLAERILEKSTMKEIVQSTGKKMEELKKDDVFDPYSVVELDTVFISSRHMMRAPYSINEKTWLVSVPITENQIKNFRLSSAKIENVETSKQFLPKPEEEEATDLIIQAFDNASSRVKREEVTIPKRTYEIPKTKIPESFFPPCILKLNKGLPTDGRKRAVFIMINFYKQMGYTIEEIETHLMEWNKKNYQPLKEGYIRSQVSWHKRQKDQVPPPNCSHESYYAALGIQCPKVVCEKVKNPVNYAMRQVKMVRRKSRQKVGKKPSKVKKK
jgi:hypothetical protein